MGKGKGKKLFALRCVCGRHLEAADKHGLGLKVATHLRRDHSMVDLDEAEIRGIVRSRSYRYEFAEVYAGVAGPDEEFGPEPY